jgi:hypothetical protein
MLKQKRGLKRPEPIGQPPAAIVLSDQRLTDDEPRKWPGSSHPVTALALTRESGRGTMENLLAIDPTPSKRAMRLRVERCSHSGGVNPVDCEGWASGWPSLSRR